MRRAAQALDPESASERCLLCGEPVEAGDLDAVEVGGGIVHGDCLAEREDEGLGLFGSNPATGRDASFECSVAELERQARSARRARERRKETTMDKVQMMAKHAATCARLARGERTVEDVLGHDDFCLMRVAANSYACFDCELIVFSTDTRPPVVSERVEVIELTDDQLEKVMQVLQNSGKWDCVHALDGTMEELQREVDDHAAERELRPLMTPEEHQEWRDILVKSVRVKGAA